MARGSTTAAASCSPATTTTAATIDGYVAPSATTTPEPGTVALTAVGLGLVGATVRRRASPHR